MRLPCLGFATCLPSSPSARSVNPIQPRRRLNPPHCPFSPMNPSSPRNPSFLLALISATLLSGAALHADWSVELPARGAASSGFPRLLEIELPGAKAHAQWSASTGDGKALSIQQDSANPTRFLLQAPPGIRGQVRIAHTSAKPHRSMMLTTNDHRIEFSADGKRLAGFQTSPGEFPRPDIKPIFRRGGYFHPLATPSGHVVTDDFPKNHVHHHGVWFAWTKTEFEGRHPDFWNMGDGKGKVEFGSLDGVNLGPLFASIRSSHRYVDLTSNHPVTALKESWESKVFVPWNAASARMIDIDVRQQCAGAASLKLPEYRYGGIGIRGHGSWDGTNNAHFLTSNGESDRIKAHATRARWCFMGGKVEGSDCGMAVLAHPSNFRAPEPIRVHPSEPFLNFAPSQAGDFEIRPGSVYRARYRILVFDGLPDKAAIDEAWNDYAGEPIQGKRLR